MFYVVEKEAVEFIPGLEDLIEENKEGIMKTMLLQRIYQESNKFDQTAKEVADKTNSEEEDVPF